MDPLAGASGIGFREHNQVVGDVGRRRAAAFESPAAGDGLGVLAVAVKHDDCGHAGLGRVGRYVNVVGAVGVLRDRLVGERGHAASLRSRRRGPLAGNP